jgi:biopolymer transport protein ExbD
MSHGNGKKDLSFELDLLPFISVLSCCICFLLLTAVWSHIGSLNIAQGLGQESTRADQTTSSVWVTMKANGDVAFSVKDNPDHSSRLNDVTVGSSGGKVNWSQVNSLAQQLSLEMPALKTALIMPQTNVAYGDVITLMDDLKKQKINEIGIAPL